MLHFFKCMDGYRFDPKQREMERRGRGKTEIIYPEVEAKDKGSNSLLHIKVTN